MKKFLSGLLFILSFLILGCSAKETESTGLINPWSDCGKDFNCAVEKSGINFISSDFSIRAMKNMIEISYPIDNKRILTVRKSSDKGNEGDISGDYNVYPIIGETVINDNVVFKTRGDKNLIKVASFISKNGYYSIMCNEGFTLNELKKIYDVLSGLEN